MNQDNVAAVTEVISSPTNQDRKRHTLPLLTTKLPMAIGTPRFCFGYARDGSEIPVYFLWPERAEDNSLYLFSVNCPWYGHMPSEPTIQPLGIHHFYDAFRLCSKIELVDDARCAFGLSPDDLHQDLAPTVEAAKELGLETREASDWQDPDAAFEAKPAKARKLRLP